MATSRNTGTPTMILTLFLLSFCLLIVTLPVGCSADTQLGVISPDVDTQIQQLLTSNVVPSFQAGIVLNARLVWAKGYGAQPDLDTAFMVGSVTKTFTATAVLQLYERNLIGLDDDVNQYFPFSVRNPDYPSAPITIRNLLIHTSGLGIELPYSLSWQQSTELSEWMNNFADYNITIWNTRPSIEEFLNGSLSTSGPYYSTDVWYSRPNWEWSYSSTGYFLLSYLVERVTNQSLAEYARENILSPLGMTNTGFSATDFAGRNAIPYERINGTDHQLPIYDIYDEGAGGLRSTVSDLARFMGAHMNDGTSGGVQILKPETAVLMHQAQINIDRGVYDGFGLGWFLSEAGLQGHSGTVPGYMVNMRYNETDQGSYGIILMLNRGYVLGYDMDFVDNFYTRVNQLLWQEAQRMFNASPTTLDLMPLMTVAGHLLFVSCLVVFAAVYLKGRRGSRSHTRGTRRRPEQ